MEPVLTFITTNVKSKIKKKLIKKKSKEKNKKFKLTVTHHKAVYTNKIILVCHEHVYTHCK